MAQSSRCLGYEGVDAAWEARELRAFSGIRGATSVADFLLGRLLAEDLHVSCKPMLPPDVQELNGKMIQGVCLLQIVDIVNIGANFEHRTEDSKGPTRTLKLCLTDGHQTVFGFEYKWLPSLSVKTPRGSKILVQNVAIRHGMLMLTPESCQVLGVSGNDALDASKLSCQEMPVEKPAGAYSAALMTGGASFSSRKASNQKETPSTRPLQTYKQPTPKAPMAPRAPALPQQSSLPRTVADLLGIASAPSRTQFPQESSMSRAAGAVPTRQTVFSPPRPKPEVVHPVVFVDVSSDDEDIASDVTDPMVEHLFYSPNTPRIQREASSRRSPSRKRPHPDSSRSRPSTPPPINPFDVVDMTDSPPPINRTDINPETAFSLLPAEPIPPPAPPANLKDPFVYFNSNTSSIAASTTRIGSIITIRGFVKSVAGFQFNTGVYKLRVLIEDGTATKDVNVDPALVETLMGVPCVQFLQAMQKTPPVGRQLAAKMQVVLMTMQGIMQLRLDGTPDKWTLLECRHFSSNEAHALLARVRHLNRNNH